MTNLQDCAEKFLIQNEKDVSKITDYGELIRRWQKYSSKLFYKILFCKPIEARMAVLNAIELPTITDYDELIGRWWNCSKDFVRKPIEARLAELNTACIDYDKLKCVHRNFPVNSVPEEQFEARMVELLDSVDASDPPEWVVTNLSESVRDIKSKKLLRGWRNLSRRILDSTT